MSLLLPWDYFQLKLSPLTEGYYSRSYSVIFVEIQSLMMSCDHIDSVNQLTIQFLGKRKKITSSFTSVIYVGLIYTIEAKNGFHLEW